VILDIKSNYQNLRLKSEAIGIVTIAQITIPRMLSARILGGSCICGRLKNGKRQKAGSNESTSIVEDTSAEGKEFLTTLAADIEHPWV